MKDNNARVMACTAFTMVFAGEAARSGHTFTDWQMWAAIALPLLSGIVILAVMDWMDGEK